MARKQIPTAEPVVVEINTQAVEGGMRAHDTLALLDAPTSDEQLAFSQRIGERLGRRRLIGAMQKLVTVTDLLEIRKIKESKEYRGQKLIGADGKVVTVTTFAEYCEIVEGRSVESVDRDLLNLNTFGSEFLEAAQSMGIGYRELREMRSIPADNRTALLEAAQTGDKDAVLDLAETLIERHVKARDELVKQLEEKTETAEARQKLLDAANTERDALKEKALRPFKPKRGNPAKTIEEQAALTELSEALTAVEVDFMRLSTVVYELNGEASQPLRERAEQAVQYLVSRMREIVLMNNIEVRVDDETLCARPSWLPGASLGDQGDADAPSAG